MDQRQLPIVIAVIAALVVIAVISFLLARKRRSQQLRARFGPEYDRVLKTRHGAERRRRPRKNRGRPTWFRPHSLGPRRYFL